jgi:hypothetical protein
MRNGHRPARPAAGLHPAHWWSIVGFSATVAGVACGGAVSISESGGDARVDAGSGIVDAGGINEASSVDQSCSLGSDCSRDAYSPMLASHDAEAGRVVMSDSSSADAVLCGLHTGPLTSGQDAGGAVMTCGLGSHCVNLDGDWACCTVEGTGGAAICQPFWTDGGS